MLSYEFYKVLHVFCIVLFVGSMGAQFFSDSSKKSLKIISGVTSFLIFVGGMGLLARLGIKHGAGWPMWVWVKVVMWILVSALGPILAKRLKGNRALGYYGILVLIFVAIYSAVTKLA
ncbi:SirB2 family protein [Bacteriovorax sp. Seq25_V]|uniref:SirB2 family protein n=1 Tax=Bacteriovorax sp. Seq25_V TaxID=1201288 RepID=UPI000389F95E|nr:SirB2 family protein [Bacteriovorax sp. Seq25_V]EQC46142.1 hypothetical protein M900_1808 [Bacteriovorax sp. Seq25_V]